MTRGDKERLKHSPAGSASKKAEALREILGPDYEVLVLDDSTVEIDHNSQRLCTVAFGKRPPLNDDEGRALRS